jgi:hypothetical protein
MEKITAYKLTDGSIIEDKALATKKQKRLDFEAKAREFAEKHGTYQEGKKALFAAITENTEELKKVLALS